MNVNPGELNKRIKIQRYARVKDADGYYAEDWVTVCEPWAKFSRESGAELREAKADFAEIHVRFLIRYREGIDRKMTVLYRGSRYEIEYLNDYGDSHEYIEILAKCRTQGVSA